MALRVLTTFKEWTRADWLVIAGLVVATGAVVAGVVTPEIRKKLGLEQPDPKEAVDKFYLASMRYGGQMGIPVDRQRAVTLWKDSAELGYPPAQYQVGSIYEMGMGGETINMKRAVEWYEKAAKNGSAQAMERLGEIHEHRQNDVEMNLPEAIEWYRKAATGREYVQGARMALSRLCASGAKSACNIVTPIEQSTTPSKAPETSS
jgi:TPR repeat protein